MRIHCLNDLSALQSYAEVWNRMAAGVPFRSWEWLSTWWQHYGPSTGQDRHPRRLTVLCVVDERERPVGFAPLYSETTTAGGRVLRLLGDGEVCSEYLGILADPGREEAVALAVAEHLADRFHASRTSPDRWDLMQFEAVDAGDAVLQPMLSHLEQLGATVHRRPGPGCWRMELPDSWDALLARLSKNQRRQIRRLLKANEKREVKTHLATNRSELTTALEHLVDLHRRRWQSRGLPGSFASERFLAFHREVTPQLLRAGQLHMLWLEVEDRPLAAEYQMVGGSSVYLYQAGIDPDRLAYEPGHLTTALLLQRAIDLGFRWVDLLRGDEPYKAQWRAAFHSNASIRIVAPRTSARLRHQAWLAVRTAKDLARCCLKTHP